MKISNSSVFISGIDDVEKVFSYPHPAVKQMDYQVEVPELAQSRTSFLATVFLKAVARDVRLHMVTDLENYWSVLMGTVGKGHDKTQPRKPVRPFKRALVSSRITAVCPPPKPSMFANTYRTDSGLGCSNPARRSGSSG